MDKINWQQNTTEHDNARIMGVFLGMSLYKMQQYKYDMHGFRLRQYQANELIEAEWRIDASVNHTIISWDNGLPPILNQGFPIISWSIGYQFQWNLNENSMLFIQGTASENVVCAHGGHFVWPSMCKNAMPAFPHQGASGVMDTYQLEANEVYDRPTTRTCAMIQALTFDLESTQHVKFSYVMSSVRTLWSSFRNRNYYAEQDLTVLTLFILT